MKPTIRVSVCTGTTCYVMGAAESIDELEEALANDPGLSAQVQLSGSTCLGYCLGHGSPVEKRGAPFVTVDDAIVAQASSLTVMEEIKRRCTNGTQ